MLKPTAITATGKWTARTKKPTKHYNHEHTSRTLAEVTREFNRLLAAQTPDDIELSYEELIT